MDTNTRYYDYIFLGLAQNCEKHLYKFFNMIDKLSQNFKIIVLIGENGSDDLTFHKIQTYINKNINVEFIDTTFIEKFPDRIERLANARQSLKNYLSINKIVSKYICVVDLDDVLNENFNTDFIEIMTQLLKKNEQKYFGVSVKSKPFYYDILNFESDEFPNYSIKQLQNNKTIKSYWDRKRLIYDVQKKLTLKEEIECISAFNGFCIYLFNDFKISHYLDKNYDVMPEHLHLNRIIHKVTKKKILVSDHNLQMPNEHKPLDNIFLFIFEKLIKYISIFFKNIIKNVS